MLNRKFFESEFPAALAAFAEKKKCDKPILEFNLYSGQSFLVTEIIKMDDRWMKVEALTEDRELTHAYVPYKNIARLTMHAKMPTAGKIGF